ncbi:MAG TPA: GNAT family N-acetyltransferase [Nocardioides sp.]|uniref:GNAT family N-acetyltransferase n=1 Tax=Nocardioides sp. TaxID=35761 RepID=UPI002E364A67|nr:GNAT family N-acetyltransferase [Nocardioides sp.]HEX5087597.1 GNAT family N-acetyltransferase [Nocardioides sp.]
MGGLFCGVDLAAEIEHAEAELMAACAGAARATEPGAFALRLGGGFATYAGVDSPFTKVAGLGFAPVSPGELEEVEGACATVGVPVSVELSTLAGHELGTMLVDRGYRLVSFENVLGRGLRPGDTYRPLPDGVSVEPATDREKWLAVVVEGSAHADEQGLAAHEEFPRQVVEHAERQLLAAGERPFLARLNGVPAGGGTWRPAGRVAQLGGAATLPAHRRRGVQSALLDHRLRDAAAAGHEVAVVTTQPGSKSQENVQRAGFELLYARAVLVRDR